MQGDVQGLAKLRHEPGVVLGILAQGVVQVRGDDRAAFGLAEQAGDEQQGGGVRAAGTGHQAAFGGKVARKLARGECADAEAEPGRLGRKILQAQRVCVHA